METGRRPLFARLIGKRLKQELHGEMTPMPYRIVSLLLRLQNREAEVGKGRPARSETDDPKP